MANRLANIHLAKRDLPNRLPAIEKKTNKSGDKTKAAPNRFQPLFAPDTNDYEEKFPLFSASSKSQKDPDQLFLDVAEVNISLLSLIRDHPLDRRSRRTVIAEVKCLDKEVNLAKGDSARRMSLEKRINALKGLSSTKLAEKFNLTNDEDLVSIDLKVRLDEAAEAEDRKVDIKVENEKMSDSKIISDPGSSESDEEDSKGSEEAEEEEGTNSEHGISQYSGTGQRGSILAHPHHSNAVRFDNKCVETIESSKDNDIVKSGHLEGFPNVAHQVNVKMPTSFSAENHHKEPAIGKGHHLVGPNRPHEAHGVNLSIVYCPVDGSAKEDFRIGAQRHDASGAQEVFDNLPQQASAAVSRVGRKDLNEKGEAPISRVHNPKGLLMPQLILSQTVV
ncbi:hypothetical protein U1Q18_009814 [Sarracenia purpurea var. burkii]